MQQVLLFDPQRTPKTWVEMLRPGQFAVLLLDVHTSVIVDREGAPASDPEKQCCYLFDGIEEARRFCADVVERADNVRCEIYDERGKAAEPLYTIVHPQHEHRVLNHRHPRLLIAGGALVAVLAIPLLWIDWQARWAKIWPTLLAINAVVLGLRLFYWGFGELAQLRRQKEEQAAAEAKSRMLRASGE